MRAVLLILTALVFAGPATAARKNLWRSVEELQAIDSTQVGGWTTFRDAASSDWGTADIGDFNHDHAAKTLAGAMYAIIGNSASLKAKVRDGIIAGKRSMDAPSERYDRCTSGTGSAFLGLSRQLSAYVMAADIIDLQAYDSAADTEFRNWLAGTASDTSILRTKIFVKDCSNNEVGTPNTLMWSMERHGFGDGFASARSVATARIYLGQTDSLTRAYKFFEALTDRSKYPTDAWAGQDGVDGWGDQDYFRRSYAKMPCLQDTIFRPHVAWLCNGNAHKDWLAISPSCSRTDTAGTFYALGVRDSSGTLLYCRPWSHSNGDNDQTFDLDGALVLDIERTCRSTCVCRQNPNPPPYWCNPNGGNDNDGRCNWNNDCGSSYGSQQHNEEWGPPYWPPDSVGTMYSRGSINRLFQGAELYYRQGKLDAYTRGSSGLKRAIAFLDRAGWFTRFGSSQNLGPWMANYRYATSYSTNTQHPRHPVLGGATTAEATHEEGLGWTRITHAGPKQIQDLNVTTGNTTITLSFTAPGDASGAKATDYDVRVRLETEEPPYEAVWFGAAQITENVPTPKDVGQSESFTLTGFCPGRIYHVGLRAKNAKGYSGSVVKTVSTTGVNDPSCPESWLREVGVEPAPVVIPKDAVVEYYDIAGRRLSAAPTRPGLYYQVFKLDGQVLHRRPVIVRR